MTESVIITVKMTISGSDYFMATQGFTGSNFYNPFVQSLPRIEWSGEGFLKTQAGQLNLTNDPDNSEHPFGYATNWNSLITNPDQQFITTIHPGEPEGDKVALWYGYSVIRNISENALTFDLFEFAKYSALSNQRSIGSYSVSSLTAGNPTILTVDNREMGSNTASDWIAVGDFITVNNTFSPVIANTQYLVTATSGNDISINLDSTSASFATPRVVTNSYNSGSGTQCVLNKILTVPYVAFSTGSTKREIPRNHYYQDGFYGHYFFTPFNNWYPATGSNFKIYIDGVDLTSSFTLATKSYKRSDGASYDGTITVETVVTYKTVFDLVDLLYSPCTATKAPNSDDSVLAGLMIEYSEDTTIEDFLDFVCKNTNHQFYVRYTSATDSALNSYLIDRGNIPSATALDNYEITDASYTFKNPIKAVVCTFKTRNESGTLAGDNYQYIESEKTLGILNSDLPTGSIIATKQVHDSTGQQLNYLTSILEVEKKIYLTVTLDNINTTILPGDNLTFTRNNDKVTVDQLLVRKIIYDLNSQKSTFCGDGTITLIEKA
jgi:hypothetical protein